MENNPRPYLVQLFIRSPTLALVLDSKSQLIQIDSTAKRQHAFDSDASDLDIELLRPAPIDPHTSATGSISPTQNILIVSTNSSLQDRSLEIIEFETSTRSCIKKKKKKDRRRKISGIHAASIVAMDWTVDGDFFASGDIGGDVIVWERVSL